METQEPSLLLSSEGRKRQGPNRYGAILLFSCILGFFGGVLGWWLGPRLANDFRFPLPALVRNENDARRDEVGPATIPESLSSEESLLVGLVEKSTPAVVSVVITKNVPKYRRFFNGSGFPFFFGSPFDEMEGNQDIPFGSDSERTEKQTIGEGSGFLVSTDGIIVTNRHVVEDMQADYTVITGDKKEHVAQVLARDPSQDIAILKIDGEGFPALPFGDSDAVKVGQTAIAIGNSLGEFSNTVSRGIISGLRRSLVAGSSSGSTERLSGILQTDAAINPGNSGGPLLDLSGSVIGVNVAIAAGAQNIGFAIPANSIKRALQQVRETGKISTPFLGVRYAIVTADIQKENNLPFPYGALVVRGQRVTDIAVIPGSPADKAGVVENDIILEIDGTKIDSDTQLSDIVGAKRVGDSVTMKVWHRGDSKDVQVVLEERK